MSVGELLLVIGVSAVTSYLTTKNITIHYFKVIDGYVKGLFEDTKRTLRKAADDECLSKRR